MGLDDTALDDYRRKRDFSRTPEPAPLRRRRADDPRTASAPPPTGRGGLYVVHKHAARSLHYDLRLELNGVLLSWAVPRGPSLDPGQKRLAVRVEDHPLEYADFEGVIPAGEYGAGSVMIWDRGTWEPTDVSRDDPERSLGSGQLKFALHGEKLRGRWMLVRLKDRRGESGGKNWLLFKERDEEARTGPEAAITDSAPLSVRSGRTLEQIAAGEPSAPQAPGSGRSCPGPLDASIIPGARRRPLPDRVEPELATLVARAPAGDEWLHEVKLDGYRVMCRLKDGTPRFLTRRGADWTGRLSHLQTSVGRLPAAQAWLDGEVVYLEDDGRTSFVKLAAALQRGHDGDRSRIVYFVFDLLYLDGYDLTKAPLLARKDTLAALLEGLPADDRIRLVDHVRGAGDDLHRVACDYQLEGTVSKRVDAPYRPGRGRDWLKVKCLNRQEFVIVGFTTGTDDRGVGSLLLGFRPECGEPLRFAGRVGTGWDQAAMADLRTRLDALVQDGPTVLDPPTGRAARGARWVRPELVAEIDYLAWNRRGALRHGSFKGLRLDKPAVDVVPENVCTEPGKPFTPPADALRPSGAGEPDAAHAVVPVDARRRRRSERGALVGGVVITHPDRVIYPESGITKLDLARYYEDVADRMLPYVSRRPLTLVRCPEGQAGDCFYQRHAVAGFPDEVLRVPMRESGGTATYVAVDSTAGLLSLVQMGTLELHVWGSRLEALDYPDELVFDLDPHPDLPFAVVNEAARLLRTALDAVGLDSFVTTTGGKGLHVVSPLEPARRWDEVKAFAKGLAEALAAADPDHYTTSMAKRERVGRVFIDYLRNGRGATFIAPYSTRRHPGAPVATPLRWSDLTPDLRADRYGVRNLRRRLAALRSDPWEGFQEARRQITAQTLRAVGVA